MSKELIQRLTTYLNLQKSKLSDKTVPEKQKNRQRQYREYLEKDIAYTKAKLEDLMLAAPTESKK